ncbi:MAG TPA: AMP-binding protein [Miltoncostaeaceae bacterium]|nr:AMP-binding protein [Miltoncostaeaceae bacterium]
MGTSKLPGAERGQTTRNLTQELLDLSLPATSNLAAVRFPGGGWTYGELAARMGAIAGALRAAGVRRGDVVALALPDSPVWVAAFLAIARIGAVVAPVSSRTPSDVLESAVARSAATLILSDEPGLCRGLPRLDSGELARAIAERRPDPGPEPVEGDPPCYLLLTSGSTGAPRWAVHRHGDIPFCLASYGRHVLDLRPGDVTHSVAALATSYGLGNSLYFPLGAGACAWVDGQRPTPDATAAAVAAGANVLFGVPTSWARLARHVTEGRLAADTFASVRLGVSAGEPLPPAAWRAVRNALGIELVDGLGCSEMSNLYVSNRPGRTVPGSIGWLVPGFSARVVDRSGRDAAPGRDGELVVRGRSMMSRYLGDEAATRRVLHDGWLRTGDLVRRSPDGSFIFRGRIADRFKAGGAWVAPAAVEALLRSHPHVVEAAVVPAPDPLGLARVVAVVTAVHIADPTELRRGLTALAAERLAPHETPRAIVVVDALPTTPSGKVRRPELVRLGEAALAEGARVGV